ncbi:MAG TPA: hypothetical protein VKX96_08245, partial [Chloroflexota bacterium]|nr:hypothetical protein [Chloroflexota bacterium]
YVAYSGFNVATPSTPGHVFKTTDAGQTWTDVSGNLPDAPVNAIVLDPSDPNTLYVGTDVGPLYTTTGGAQWSPLGTNFPIDSVFQLDLNPYTGILRAATHGRGVWEISTTIHAPVLQLRTRSDVLPTGPGDLITYTVMLQNVGSTAATGVVITAPIPANTTFASAANGGSPNGNSVVWNNLSLAQATVTDSIYGSVTPSSLTVSYSVWVNNNNNASQGVTITNNSPIATTSQGASVTGSPMTLMILAGSSATATPTTTDTATATATATPTSTSTPRRTGIVSLIYFPIAFNGAPSGGW